MPSFRYVMIKPRNKMFSCTYDETQAKQWVSCGLALGYSVESLCGDE